MSENKIQIVGYDENGNEQTVFLPVRCSVRLVSSRKNPTLKAIARLSFGGLTINDIQIHEEKAELSVIYPTRAVIRKGKETNSSIAFPNNGYTSNTLKHIIVNRYSEAMLNVGGHPYLKVLDKKFEKESAA